MELHIRIHISRWPAKSLKGQVTFPARSRHSVSMVTRSGCMWRTSRPSGFWRLSKRCFAARRFLPSKLATWENGIWWEKHKKDTECHSTWNRFVDYYVKIMFLKLVTWHVNWLKLKNSSTRCWTSQSGQNAWQSRVETAAVVLVTGHPSHTFWAPVPGMDLPAYIGWQSSGSNLVLEWVTWRSSWNRKYNFWVYGNISDLGPLILFRTCSDIAKKTYSIKWNRTGWSLKLFVSFCGVFLSAVLRDAWAVSLLLMRRLVKSSFKSSAATIS